MKYAFLFLLLFFVCIWAAADVAQPVLQIAWGYVGLNALLLGLAYALDRPALLGKKPDGTFRKIAFLVFLPYYLVNALFLPLLRLMRVVQGPVEIAPRLWLGPRLLRGDATRIPAMAGAIDLTAELVEEKHLRGLSLYRCFPVLDGMPPSVQQFHESIEWGVNVARTGNVYVHCASGHGRSVVVLAGIMVRMGHATSAEDAVKRIRELRPRAGPKPAQMEALKKYLAGGERRVTNDE